jgi:transcriptional regulator with XRE-family HTH domain
MTTLPELIRNRLEELDLSYRKAAERSGGLMSYSTLNNLALGRYPKTMTERTMKGLALALDVPFKRVVEAAAEHGPQPRFALPREADKLTPKQRQAVVAMVRALLESQP